MKFAENLPEKYGEFADIRLLERALEGLLHTDAIFSPRGSPGPHLMYVREAT